MDFNTVTAENWNFCQYKSDELKAFISLGASPDILDNKFTYFVTVLDEHNNELQQDEFDDINAACHFINNKYSQIWDFNNLSVKESSGSGCGSCVAH
jgi:hypothetical protein